MNSITKIAFGLFFFLIFSTSINAGGGWPQPKGSSFIKLSTYWLIADQHFTATGQIDPNRTNGIFNSSIYAEYGITDRLTGVVYFPFFSRSYFNNTVSGTTGEQIEPGEAINTLGDSDISLKYGLITNGPVALSATLTFGLPLGEDAGGREGALQTGDGEFNQLLQIDAGKGFQIGKTNAYANAYVGFNNRTNGFSDEFRYGIEAGANLFDNKITAILRLFGVESLQNGDSNADRGSGTSIFANNAEYLSISPEITYNFNDKWGVSAGAGFAVSGKLIYANPSYNVGIFFKW